MGLPSLTLFASARVRVRVRAPLAKASIKPLRVASASARHAHTRHAVVPKTAAQVEYARHLSDPSAALVIATGAAGSGKTLLACAAALEHLDRGTVSRIVLVRPAVGAREELGFLPGSLEDKLRPWMAPLYDALGRDRMRTLTASGALEVASVAHLRGRTFDDAFVVADEMQNADAAQFFMVATRIGQGCKMVMTGDPYQSDLPAGRSGLTDFLARLTDTADQDGLIRVVRLGQADCQRHPVVKEVLAMYGSPGA